MSQMSPDLPPGTGSVQHAPGMTDERLLGWLVAYRLNQVGRLVLPNLIIMAWRARGWTKPSSKVQNLELLTEVGLGLTDLNAAEYGTSFENVPAIKEA